MTISERLFQIMEMKGISQYRLAQMTGISRKTIYDWSVKGTNPGADKIMLICSALEITPEMLLSGDNVVQEKKPLQGSVPDILSEQRLIESYRNCSESNKRRLLAYLIMLENSKG